MSEKGEQFKQRLQLWEAAKDKWWKEHEALTAQMEQVWARAMVATDQVENYKKKWEDVELRNANIPLNVTGDPELDEGDFFFQEAVRKKLTRRR